MIHIDLADEERERRSGHGDHAGLEPQRAVDQKIVSTMTIPPRRRLLQSVIAARSSSSMMSARFSTVTCMRFE